MTHILIRNVDDKLDKALRISAAQHGCTRETEIKTILENVALSRPKRSLAEALLSIPDIESDSDMDLLFGRSDSPARHS